ncbi:MAG: hypothetical protein IJU23_05620 [Proteobacteria bacterium]|nr:hypothetical protein [Pseudomonadota bacterium]
MRQIALGGFLGVYSGCMPLTVNLARLPYKRGAVIGVFFGALTHLMTTLLYILAAISIGNAMGDKILHYPATWVVVGLVIFVIQCLSSIGCMIMGKYFLSPAKKSDVFNRDELYRRLKEKDLKDNPEDGSRHKTSVMHDVVLLLESRKQYPDVRYSTVWIIFFGILSIASICIWISTLNRACLEVLFLGVKADAGWYLEQALYIFVPFITLIITHFSTMFWLCRDAPNSSEDINNSESIKEN